MSWEIDNVVEDQEDSTSRQSGDGVSFEGANSLQKKRKLNEGTAQTVVSSRADTNQFEVPDVASSATPREEFSVPESALKLLLLPFTKEELEQKLFQICSVNREAYDLLREGADSDTRWRKVFVVGFLKTTTENELIELFSQYGEVEEVNIIRDKQGLSKCFGFITFRSFDGASHALEEPHKTFQNREMHCKLAAAESQAQQQGPSTLAHTQQAQGNGGDAGSVFATGAKLERGREKGGGTTEMTREEDIALRKVFVRGLANETTDDSFLSYFGQFGEIENGKITRDKVTSQSRGYGFVTYRSRVSSMRCLEEQLKQLDSRVLHTNLAEKDAKLFGGATGSEEILRKLFIRGLNYTSSDDSLLALMSQYGEVEECYIAKDKQGQTRGYGFCIFKHASSAMLCLEEATKELDGRTIFINLAERGKKQLQERSGAQYGSSAAPTQSNTHSSYSMGAVNPGASSMGSTSYGLQPQYYVAVQPQQLAGGQVGGVSGLGHVTPQIGLQQQQQQQPLYSLGGVPGQQHMQGGQAVGQVQTGVNSFPSGYVAQQYRR